MAGVATGGRILAPKPGRHRPGRETLPQVDFRVVQPFCSRFRRCRHCDPMPPTSDRHASRVETLPPRDLRAGQPLPAAPGVCWHRAAPRYRFFFRFRRCRHWDPMSPTSGRHASRVETLPPRDLRAGHPLPAAPGVCWHRSARRYRFFSRFRRCRHWDPMPPTSGRHASRVETLPPRDLRAG